MLTLLALMTKIPSPPPSILPERLPVEVTVKTLFWPAAPSRLAKPSTLLITSKSVPAMTQLPFGERLL